MIYSIHTNGHFGLALAFTGKNIGYSKYCRYEINLKSYIFLVPLEPTQNPLQMNFCTKPFQSNTKVPSGDV